MSTNGILWIVLSAARLLAVGPAAREPWPAVERTEPHFQQVVLDNSYIAYERDVGDINGDGHNDVVAVMEGDTTVQVFHAPTWKRSTLVTFAGEHRYPRADDFKLADMDGDGDSDVVTRLGKGPADDGAGIAIWCENLGSGSNFVQHLIGNSPEYVKDIVVADFDRDGRPDVAMRMDSRTQLWLQEPGRTWTEVLLTHPAHEGMEGGDLDMDGDPDLIFNGGWFETPGTPAAARVVGNYAHHVIDSAWFNQTGDWTKNSCKVVVGDFDGDGKNDVAFSHSERAGHAVAWYGSDTPRVDGNWSKHTVAVVDFCHTLQAADFDLDGDVDLLAGGMIQSQHRGLRLLLNGGKGTSWTQSIIQTDGSYSAELGDIDNDGDADIVGIRNWNAAPTWIYRNDIRRGATGPQVVASHDSPWGGVKATLGDGPEGDGTILLENRAMRIRYTAKRFHDGNKDHVITEFLVKKTGGQLAVGDQLDGIWMNADEGRGRMASARVAFDGPDRKTLHVEWDEGKVVQEFTIWPDRSMVRIDYLRYGINIVDMVRSVDTFEVYGAKPWQEARIKAANETLLNISNPHHRLTKDLYPRYPFPLIAGKDWEKLEPRELTYHGHLILGACQQETGLGFGRVFPAQDANYIKLLNTGFEVFANWRQPHRQFIGYLYAVTGGPEELMAVGKAIAEGDLRAAPRRSRTLPAMFKQGNAHAAWLALKKRARNIFRIASGPRAISRVARRITPGSGPRKPTTSPAIPAIPLRWAQTIGRIKTSAPS